MARRSAILVLDLLNEIVHPDGKYASHGYAEQAEKRGLLTNAATAIARARDTGIPVVHVLVGFSADYAEWPATSPIFAEARPNHKLVVGTWGTQFHESVRPSAGEQIVVKRRISPFYGTELDVVLRTRNVNHLLLAGVSTDLVVLAAARDAHDRDYETTVLADATAAATDELHEAALKVLARTATVTTVDSALPPRRHAATV
jgi:nicotinamidase-related amidase